MKDIYDIAYDLYYQKRYTETIKLLESSKKKSEKDTGLMIILGGCYIKLGHFSDAVKVFLKAKEIKPNDSAILYNLGYSMICMGRLNDGFTYLKECLKYNPPKEIVKMANNMIKSEKEFKEKCEDKSFLTLKEDFDLHDKFMEARDYLYSNNYKKAILLYEEILKKNPNHAASIQNIGLCYLNDGKMKESIPYFEKAHQLDKADFLSLVNLFYAYSKLGEKDKADYYIESIMKEIKNPLFRDITRIIAIFIDSGKYLEAEELIKRFSNDETQMIFLKGVLNAKQKNYLGALKNFQVIMGEFVMAKKYCEKVKEIMSKKINDFNFDPMIFHWDIDVI